MKKIISLSAVLVLSLSATTIDCKDRNFDGYSYFAFGMEHFKYSEKFIYTFNNYYKSPSGKEYFKGNSVAVKSKLDVTNPVYLSGSLIKMNDKWDLSMDFISTLKPNIAKEKWLDRGDDSTIVTNDATVMSNSMKFLLQYKITNSHRFTFGLGYNLNIFKRFSDADSTKLVEETAASASLRLGYWFESNTAAKDGLRIKYQINGGIPIYESVTNTAASDLEYHHAKGFDLDTDFYIGYPLMKGLEIGAFTNYTYSYREGQTKYYKGKEVIWPDNITQAIRGGIQFSWKFN